ncbi:SDR family NAD(P)-dependent oxidoreductase [Janthinobacterium sp. FT14W]|uniref:SDR family NAD(P)-dependent oxidoreductase n=1 Tax=Janthinobacterium sp. FT14W TaxID=2654253 RepID=UPI0012653A31|nr:SDR family NAD(P)-dependent oxidoreductase [Janthinobacterium sp. FT14W]KAB8061482.1 SDR family NAD(P)-dependent oxidoreductase [Janthinobacterium sp. FT14W]
MGQMNHAEYLQEWAESYLTTLIADTVDEARSKPDRDRPFAESGIDSFRVLKIIKRLEEVFGRLPKTLLFENINIAELAAYFAQHHAATITANMSADMPARAPVQAAIENLPGARATSAAAPLLLPERDAYADAVLGPALQNIFDQYKNEAAASRGARSIAPNLFIGSARRGFFNYARCKDILLAYAYTGPEAYFLELLIELHQHCNAHQLELSVFTDRVVGTAGATRFSSTPFGALQRVVNLGQFTLEGGAMRRLRYQVSKFQKAGVARTQEYKLGTDVLVERAIASVIDSWCVGKPMVNPLVATVKQEILARTLHARHRLFLTYLNDTLENVILISPLGHEFKGYLMDLEFYGAQMPLGGLEFAIAAIIDQLVGEGHDMLSMGGTYGCRLETCPDADPAIDMVLDDLHSQGIFNDDGNLQFKNKFRPENQSIYLCRPAGAGRADNLVDLIMMIADPEAMQTSDTENYSLRGAVEAPVLPARSMTPPAMAAGPAAVSPRNVKDVEVRTEALAKCGFNPHNLSHGQVQFDLKTDSWAQLKSPAIDAQMSHLRAQLQTAAPVEDTLRAIFPFTHLLLTSSGRAAEEIFYKAMPRKGVVLQNVLFPTGLYHQIDNGFDAVELPCAAALQGESTLLFKGDLDWEAVLQRVAAEPGTIAFVCIELSNNAAGGLPVALAPMRTLRRVLQQHAIPLVMDATRVLENAHFLIEHDPECAGKSVMAVARELIGCADMVTCSLAKDFGVNCGGLVATNDTELFQRLDALNGQSGTALDAIGRKLVALALQDHKRIESQVLRRMESVRLMWSSFHERGIPLAQPAGAHCILFDVKRIAQFQSLSNPVASFVAWFYLNTGIRIGAHSVGMQQNSHLNGLVRMAVPLGLKASQVVQIIDLVVDLFSAIGEVPDLVLEAGTPARMADVHANYMLRLTTTAAATPPAKPGEKDDVKAHAAAKAKSQPAARPEAPPAAQATSMPKAPAIAPAPQTVRTQDTQAPAAALRAAALQESQPDTRPAGYAVRDIAVVGMAGRYPHARNLDALWDNLARGIDSVEPIPAERLAKRTPHGPAKQYRGGFIADVDRFDSLFFNISPREAQLMDPQERLFLEVAWEAMEDAGYTPETLVPEAMPRNIGVFVGAVWAMYQMAGLDQRHAGHDTTPNSFLWSIANHVSYCLNLCGPSMTVDTACSSSLTALYLACEAIYKGECSAAIVGGVNLDLHQGKVDINQFGGALSEDGVCRTFGKGANGYVAGEGVGAVLVKPLDDAIRDGDDIYGIIKGASINHSGRSSGYFVPSPNAQAAVILAALEQAGVDARTVGYIEAHGTGTELGDPIEIRGLSKAFEQFGVATQSCAIGSVKTNIGHLEAAAGVVGLSKVLLQMRHGQLAPSLHSRELNEFIDFSNSPFYVVQQLEPWQPKAIEGMPQALRAGISSFGAGGSNAHVIVESYQRPVATEQEEHERVFPISARTEDQLREVATRLRDYLVSRQAGAVAPATLASVAHTLQVGRKMFEHRAAIVAATCAELIARLGEFIGGGRHDKLFAGSVDHAASLNKLLTRREQDEFALMLSRGHDLPRLAQLWAEGVFSDWRSTTAHQPGQRTHLPTYPFADRRHWVGGSAQGAQSAPRAAASLAALHPMLDANESTFERQIFKKRFHERDFFIYDHLVSSIPTLPGVAYLELVRKAGELAASRPVRRIKNIMWLSPIVVRGSVSQEVLVELKPKGEVVHFEVFSLSGSNQRTLHAQGQLLYSGSPDALPERIDLDDIRARCTKVINGQDAYPRFHGLGLGLGPSFQVLGEIHKNDGETLGRLRLSTARSADLQELLLHPALVDGSLQAGVASQLDDSTAEMAVPYSIGEVEILHPLQAECWSYIVKDTKHAGSKVTRANVLIVDNQGRVLVRIRETVGIALNEVHKASAPQELGGDESLNYTYTWDPAPLAALSTADKEQGVVLLFDNGRALLDRYREALHAAGGDARRVVLVEAATQFAECDAAHFQLNVADPADFGRLFEAIERRGQRVGQACFAWPACQGAEVTLDSALEQGVFAVLYLCQALAARKLQDSVRLQYLFQSSGPFAAPRHEAINGFASALRLEHAKVLCKTIELRGTAAEQMAQIILAEFVPETDDARAIRYDGAARSVRRLKRVDLTQAAGGGADGTATGATLRERGVYLITGGAGGLGLLFAQFLASRYQARLLLTGRSELSAQQQARLAGLEKLGAEVCYLRTDMAERDQVKQALSTCRSRFGTIHGVIHGAGVLRDSYIRHKSAADMRAVFAPKVFGTVHLDEMTREDNLDFFAMFSSLSAVGGNPGQCDYAFANHFMDSFAVEREAQRAAGERHGKTLSLNWSLWQNGGMRLDEQTERIFRKATGLRPLSDQAGLDAFVLALAAPFAQVVVAEGVRDTLELAWGLRQPAAAPVAVAAPAASAGTPDAPAASSDAVLAMLRSALSQLAMDFLQLDANDIRGDIILLDLGFDSMGLATYANLVNEKFNLEITPILFFDYPSIDEIAKHLATDARGHLQQYLPAEGNASAGTATNMPTPFAAPAAAAQDEPAPVFSSKGWNPGPSEQAPAVPAKVSLSAEDRFSNAPIAIVGMSGVMPQSDDLHAFWENIRDGKNLVTIVPADRWSWEDNFGDPLKEPGKTNSKWGGFMTEVDKFDPLFFGISPREAQMMDPQQRIFLQTVWAAIEDAGHKVSDLAGTKTGMFVGVATNDYVNLVGQFNIPINAYTASGNSHSVLANRVSFLLNLRGPSAPLDTACSSSLIALHRAIESIHTGSSDMAIVGGVQVMLSPAAHISFSMAGMLSDDGKCKTFDKRANGYVRGEGTGAIFIKPLAKAEADGDHIYAVVKTTAENHGGKVTTLTAPNASAQAALLVEAYSKAKVAPSSVGYIECHGTGTSLGDPIEIQALSRAFAELYKRNGMAPATQAHCGLSSVKTNIGHLETAAGIAGILKALLAIQHKQIPANAHFEELNPYISLKGTPFYIVQQTAAWDAPRDAAGHALPRVAGVSSFGFGGANSHVVLEEYVPKPATSTLSAERPQIIVISAKNTERLKDYAARLLNHIERTAIDMGSLAYTLQVGRDAFAERLAFIASSAAELRSNLAAFLESASLPGNMHRSQVRSKQAQVEGSAETAISPEAVLELIEREELDTLARHWVGGTEIDWLLLYANGTPRRAALPTYPFARERHWMPLPEQAPPALPCTAAGAPASMLHPLVQRNTSTLQEQKFSTSFSGSEFFLTDHVVESQRVLPGVAYIEMARVAGQLAAQREVRFIRNLVWLTPLIVGEGGAEVETVLAPKGREVHFAVKSITGGQSVTHCSGQIGFAAGEQAGVQVDIALVRQRCAQEVLNNDTLYTHFTGAGLHLGKSFRIVQQMWANASESLALVALPAHIAADADRYILHPALMDGSLHSAIGLMKTGDMEPPLCLPFSVAEVEIFGSIRNVHYAHATWSADKRPADPMQWKVNFTLLDRHGKVLVRMKEFWSRPLSGNQPMLSLPVASAAANDARPPSVLHALVPVWQALGAGQLACADVAQDAAVALVGGNAAQLAWLRASYPKAQALTLDMHAGAEQMAAQMRAATFEQLVWMAPDVAAPLAAQDAAGQALVDAQEPGVLALLRITQALLAAGYATRPLHWTLITSLTRQVRAGDPMSPGHASVNGYFGSLLKECAQWDLRLLDVEHLQALSARDCLTTAGAKDGKALVHRRGEWYAQELAVAADQPQAPPAYRQNGVYLIIGGAGGIGEVLSRHLIEHYQARVVWIGRRPRDAAIENKIGTLAKLGPAPLYIAADATDADALTAAREQLLQHYPAIHGVIHSALVLRDQSIAAMDLSGFKASLSAKVDASVNLDRVFGALDLDFMLFFSSILAFNGSAGQSNYAAGCAFKDAFARHLRQTRLYPVKIMNWGYWGNVGVVADPSYQHAMAQMGIGSIEAEEGMAQLEMLVSSPLEQLALLKTVGTRALESVAAFDRITRYRQQDETMLLDIKAAVMQATDTGLLAQLQADLPSPEQEALVDEILAATLLSAGVMDVRSATAASDKPHSALARHHARWLQGSVGYLKNKQWLEESGASAHLPRPLDTLWAAWKEKRAGWIAARPHTEAQTVLIETCMQGLPGILSGKQVATDVIFPRSSMHLVEGVYKGNRVADHFNGVLGSTLAACIEQWLRNDGTRKIRILEIGAGTGGTTATLLPILQRFGEAIAEYCYTDVSKAFLMHAAQHYKPRCPAMTTAIFDVCKPLAGQPVQAGAYDLVVAANVLHATPHMRDTLRNVKAALRSDGVLLLNEISTYSVYSHLTFGLLEGWWVAEDHALRLADCPGLSPESWATLLTEEGFPTICFPASDAHQLGQQVIAAASDGLVRQRGLARQLQPTPATAEPPVRPAPAAPAIQTPQRAATAHQPLKREVSSHMGSEHIRKLVAEKLSEAVQLEAGRIRNDEPFAEYGVDSIVGVNLVRTISEALQIELDTTSLFEYSTVNDLADHIHAKWGAQITGAAATSPYTRDAGSSLDEPLWSGRFIEGGASEMAAEQQDGGRSRQEDAIAIIGMSGRFADSESVDALWRNLRDGTVMLKEVTRWKPEESVLGTAQAGQYCSRGGFIDSVDQFDPAFFRISPLEAAHMDPQQRLFLEESWKALEDAGYANKATLERRCGVFVGCGSSNYDTLMDSEPPAHAFWGNAESIIPARIAYYLDLQGPAIAVNTACSSSLVTIHLACQSLRSGETGMALAGGVFLQPTPGFHQVANRAGMLSPSGRCCAFDARADGFVPGEGVGVIVLKRLSDALRDGDHIHGVIKGSGVNQDGSSNGIIAPNAAAQERLEREVYERFGIEPESIQLLEAHGTGTLMGDSIEFSAISRAFRHYTDKTGFCAIGSAKASIGHTSTAAGVAGVLKVLLALRHKQIPPGVNFEQANPAIDMQASPFYLNRNVQPWERVNDAPRRAAVSSFGFSGTNAHLVIEEAPAVVSTMQALPGYLIALSARTGDQLHQQARRLHAFLQEHPAPAMANLSFTLLAGRTHLDARLACVVRDADELSCLLQQWLAHGAAPGVYTTPAGDGPMRERLALKKFGSFCIEQLRHADNDEALEHLATIADLYVQGYTLDYAAVIPRGAASRIPLPTYPFARERHWIEARGAIRAAPRRAALHPLLHVNTSDFDQVSYSTTFTGDEFYLAEQEAAAHDGTVQKLLPAFVQLEMVRAALALAARRPAHIAALELQQVRWGAPPVVSPGVSVSVTLCQAGDGVADFAVCSTDAVPVLHCQGRAIDPQTTAVAPVLDIAQLQNQMHGGAADGDSIYLGLTALGYRSRPAQRAVISVLRGEHELLAHLRLPAGLSDEAQDASLAAYGLHPAMAEAAIAVSRGFAGLAMGWQGQIHPEVLAALRLAAPCASEMFAWVRQAAPASGKTMTLDVDLLDADGTVSVQLHGLSFRASDTPLAVARAPAAPAQTGPVMASVEDKIEWFLRHSAAEELDVAPDALALDVSYFDLGFTSMGVANLIRRTNLLLAADLPPSIVFEYSTIRSLAARLAQTHASEIGAIVVAVTPGGGGPDTAAPAPVAGGALSAQSPAAGTGAAILEQIALSAGGNDLAGYEKLTF